MPNITLTKILPNTKVLLNLLSKKAQKQDYYSPT